MTRFLMSWILSAAALAAAAGLLGDHMNIGHAGDTTQERLIALAIAALVFSLRASAGRCWARSSSRS
jgi:putative membrane protein